MSIFLQIASPIATVIAAGVAAYFARQLGRGQLTLAERQANTAEQQARLAEMRLQHDLFDRRFEIYEAARNLLFEVFQRGNVSNEALGSFVRGTDKSIFVFDQGLTDYLNELRIQAIKLQETNSMLSADRALPVSPERSTAAQRRWELSEWLVS